MLKFRNITKFQLPRLFLFTARLFVGRIFIYASIDKIAFPGEFVRMQYEIHLISLPAFFCV